MAIYSVRYSCSGFLDYDCVVLSKEIFYIGGVVGVDIHYFSVLGGRRTLIIFHIDW